MRVRSLKSALPYLLVPVTAVALATTVLAAPASAVLTPVTVTVVGAQTYGGAPAFVGSTGVAGLTVSGITCTGLNGGATIAPTLAALQPYTISGATCSGGTLSNPNYTISGYTGSTFSVGRAPLTVTATDEQKTYATGNPALEYTITGFVNGQDNSVVSGTPTISTTAGLNSNVGQYPITISVGSLTIPANNYFFKTFTGSKLTVNPSPVTVTVFGAQNYGSTPAFGGSTGVAGLTVSGVSCTGLTGGTAISPSVPVGTTYTTDASTCSGAVLSSTNYTVAGYASGYFYVFRASLTVTATDTSKAYGDDNPALNYTITGFQNGDDASSISGTPTLVTTATKTSNVGSYPITVGLGTLSSANYKFVLVNGTLTVNPKPVTVAVAGAQNYGGTPAFAGSTGVAGLTVSGLTCTGLTGGTPIAPTLPVGTSYSVDASTCSGAVLSSTNYTISGYTNSYFYVFRQALTVTANDANRIYGTANPSFGYTITGFVNGEDSSVVSGAPTLTTAATAASNVGSYPIVVGLGTLSATNYKFILANGTLTVNPKPVNVAVAGAQNFGGTPAFAGSTGVAGLTVSAVTCTGLTGGIAITPSVPVGTTYTTDPSTCTGAVLSSANYSVGGYVSSYFYVFRAPLTVTATDANRPYGSANPSFDYTITGFVNGDDASSVSGAPSITTTATATSNVGTYSITPSLGTLTSADYKFVFSSGTLTVTPALLTVTANNASRPYGAADPTFTATITGFKNGQTTSVVSGSPAFSSDDTSASHPGTFAIVPTIGTLSATNYTFEFVAGVLTITKAAPAFVTSGVGKAYVSAVVTNSANGAAISGATITFTIGHGTTVACSAVTDVNGLASCTPSSANHLKISLSGYTASYAGSDDYLNGTAFQGLL